MRSSYVGTTIDASAWGEQRIILRISPPYAKNAVLVHLTKEEVSQLVKEMEFAMKDVL